MVPVFNENTDIEPIIRNLNRIFAHVVIVDDGSIQPVILPSTADTTLVRLERNRGKAGALKAGFELCIDNFDIIATMDADGEHDPNQFEAALAAYRNEGILIISRKNLYRTRSWSRRARNSTISLLISVIIGQRLYDTQSGQRIYSVDLLRSYLSTHGGDGYLVETDTIACAVRGGFAIKEVLGVFPDVRKQKALLQLMPPFSLQIVYALLNLFAAGWQQRLTKLGRILRGFLNL